MAATQTSYRMRNLLYGSAGFLILLATWQIVAASGVAGITVPTFGAVLKIYQQAPLAALLLRSAGATVRSAAFGLGVGSLLGIATAVMTRLLPALRAGLDSLAVVVNAVPAIALGPIFIILAGRELTPALLATIPVFFIVYVAVISGFSTPSPALGAMMTTFGARRWQLLCYLDLPAATPSLLSSLKVSVSAAMIGTVVGEWFGAPTGLGVVILNALENFQVPLMWATILLVVSISLTGYGLLSLAERWAERRFA
jgi:ABC-type nitrate/sulfonate/bicarbonate transport system permease component